MITEQERQLVQLSWQKVVAIADTAATLFYERLFEIDPSTRPLFAGTDMPAQRQKLMRTIGTAVQGLDRLDVLIPTLNHLGRRHEQLGVTNDQYETVGKALLWTLEKGLGPEFSPETKSAWTKVYVTIAGVMQGTVS
jgi:hemoglobin-like flavoprotein